ncbi:MAG: hypothetical protein V4539_16335 [Bacteroidota bacterium]
MKFSKIVLSVLCVFICAFSFSQNKDFSGTWKFAEQESISGKLYSNGSPKSFKITQAANQTIIEQTTAGANGDVTTSSTLSFDGKATETKTSTGRKKLITLTWNGTAGYTTVTATYDAADQNKLVFKTTDIYTIDDKGLVLQRKAENFMNGEVWESKAYYDKQ